METAPVRATGRRIAWCPPAPGHHGIPEERVLGARWIINFTESATEVFLSKISIAVIALVIGLAIGGFGALTFGGGMMGGAGAAAGLSAGICSTVQAAQEEGIMSAEQVDRVLSRAAQDLSGAGGVPAGHEVVGSAAACGKVLARVRESQSK
jgi:hypothetical protein